MDFKSANLIYFTGTGGTARVADAFERSFNKRSVAVQKTELKGEADPAVFGDILVLLFPVYAFNAPKPIETIGLNINGITSIGFKTIGSPKIIGSLIQNKPGMNPILAVFV